MQGSLGAGGAPRGRWRHTRRAPRFGSLRPTRRRICALSRNRTRLLSGMPCASAQSRRTHQPAPRCRLARTKPHRPTPREGPPQLHPPSPPPLPASAPRHRRQTRGAFLRPRSALLDGRPLRC
eukprot:1915560-Rhodomonas_salina.1